MSLPILGKPSLPLNQVSAFLINAHASKGGKLPASRLRFLVELYYDNAPVWGIDPAVAAAQMMHETGYMASYWSGPGRWNMAGIGVTGEESLSSKPGMVWDFRKKLWRSGHQFNSLTFGVLAHLIHLQAYTSQKLVLFGEELDPRYSKVWPRGQAQTVHDLTGRWAKDPLYGAKIERVYGAIKAFSKK